MAEVKNMKKNAIVAVIAMVVVVGAVFAVTSKSSKPTVSYKTYLNRGVTAQANHYYRLAEINYVKAIKANPKLAIGYFDLVTVQQTLNHPYRASQYYFKALKLAPHFTRALYNLAIIETHTNPAKAISLYKDVLGIVPNDAAAQFNLGVVEIFNGQKKAGVTDINLGITLNPKLRSRLVGRLGAAYKAAS